MRLCKSYLQVIVSSSSATVLGALHQPAVSETSQFGTIVDSHLDWTNMVPEVPSRS